MLFDKILFVKMHSVLYSFLCILLYSQNGWPARRLYVARGQVYADRGQYGVYADRVHLTATRGVFSVRGQIDKILTGRA